MNIYKYEEINIGQEECFTVKITKEMEDKFRDITNDVNPLHYDDSFARDIKPGFNGHVSFGMLTASFYSTFAGVYLPGKYSLIHSLEIKFKEPVYINDELIINGKVKEKNDALKLIVLEVKILNQNNVLVSKANMKVLVLS